MTELHLKYYKDLEKKIKRKTIEENVNYLSKILDIPLKKIIIAGSYRLGKSESKDIDLIIIDENIKNILNILEKKIF